jgi:hypothetical protein
MDAPLPDASGPDVPDAPVDAVTFDACVSPADADFAVTCNEFEGGCPADRPYCYWNGCLECSSYCEACCPTEGGCVERKPDDAIEGACSPTDPQCPLSMPICCYTAATWVCYRRQLMGWTCSD